MRLKFKPWAKDYIKESNHIFINSEDQLKKYINENENLQLEIGCGKGRYIHNLAKLNPKINYIAIERYEAAIVNAGQKLEEEALDNVRLWLIDVEKLNEIEALHGKIDLIHLNFSDPWPKKKHTKRRLTFPNFLNLYDLLLKDEGHIQFKTDNQGLFEYSLESLSQNNWGIYNISLNLHETDRFNIMTEYEEKFSKKGFRINYLEARKNVKRVD